MNLIGIVCLSIFLCSWSPQNHRNNHNVPKSLGTGNYFIACHFDIIQKLPLLESCFWDGIFFDQASSHDNFISELTICIILLVIILEFGQPYQKGGRANLCQGSLARNCDTLPQNPHARLLIVTLSQAPEFGQGQGICFQESLIPCPRTKVQGC